MKFLIRDDDTCAFTSPEDLLRCYDWIWGKIPINLSVTPFRIPGNFDHVPSKLKGSSLELPLLANTELVEFLRANFMKKNIDIAIHGFHHNRPQDLPEYISGKNLSEKTRIAKEYFEYIFGGPITTFVPPFNAINRAGLEALIDNNLNLIGIPSLIRSKYRPLRPENFFLYLKIKYFNIIHKIRYVYVLSINGHKEVSYFSLTPSQNLNNLLISLEKCYLLNGVFVLSTHYHAFKKRLSSGETIEDAFKIIIEKTLSMDDVDFLTYETLWNLSS